MPDIPVNDNKIAPQNATKSPIICHWVVFCLKNQKPINKVQSGVSPFNIPAMPLSKCFWAMANNIAGIAIPSKPDKAKIPNFLEENLVKLTIIKGKNTKNDTLTRKNAICKEEKTIRLFFIKINELPHIKAKTIKMPQAESIDIFGVESVAVCVFIKKSSKGLKVQKRGSKD